MKWKTIFFTMVDGKRGHIEKEGVHTFGVDLRRARRQELYIEGQTDAASWPLVAKDLVEYWKQIATVFDQCLPATPLLDQVIVEVEPEGGQIKAYFNSSQDAMRSSPVVVNAIVRIMDEAYHNLPEPDESEEAEKGFEAGIREMRESAQSALLESIRDAGAAAAMGRLVSTHGLTLSLRWESSEEDEPIDLGS